MGYSYQEATVYAYYCGTEAESTADAAAAAFLADENAAALDEHCACYDMTWTCEDAHGNSASDGQTVFVHDTLPPVIEIEEGYYNFFARVSGTKSGAATFVLSGALVGALVAYKAKRSGHAYEAL